MLRMSAGVLLRQGSPATALETASSEGMSVLQGEWSFGNFIGTGWLRNLVEEFRAVFGSFDFGYAGIRDDVQTCD